MDIWGGDIPSTRDWLMLAKIILPKFLFFRIVALTKPLIYNTILYCIGMRECLCNYSFIFKILPKMFFYKTWFSGANRISFAI